MAGRKTTTGSRYKLGEPYDSLLADYCAANYGAPRIQVIREAVQEVILARLKSDPVMNERFKHEREKRTGKRRGNLEAVTGK